jgi:hypothetical protein
MNDKFSSDGEAYLAIRQLSVDRDEIWRFFHFKSKVWKAICKHIAESKDNVLVSIPTEYFIATHRGTGHAISLRDFGVYSKNYDTKPPTESSLFWVKISIGLIHEEDADSDYWKEIDKEFSVNIPTDLMFDFSDSKFNAWISDLRRQRDAKRCKEDEETLVRLIRLYPSKTKLLLESWMHG